MISALLNLFASSRTVALALSAFLLLLAGALDINAPYELDLSFLYLVPVLVATWLAGPLWGGVAAVLALVTLWTLAVMGGHPYSTQGYLVAHMLDVAGYLLVALWLTDRLRARVERQRYMSRVDFLTQLRNKAGFHEAVADEIARQRRHHRPFSLVFIDCDDFRRVNDTQGHSGGDRLLRVVAETLQAGTRRSDVPCRLGGDEFAVLLPETGERECQAMVDHLRRDLTRRMELNGWEVTFSMGVAVMTNVPESVDQALSHGDELMYSLKAGGKDAVLCRAF